MSYNRVEEELDMTVEDFANWLLALPEEYKTKKIWFIDISMPYKDKPLEVESSPSGSHISIVDSKD